MFLGWGRRPHQPANHIEENRGQENPEQRNADHPGDDRRTQGAAHFGARALRDHHRHHAKDERERRHHDGAKSDCRRLNRCRSKRISFHLPVAGELDDQDGVLARQPRQNHKSDLHEG
jgi:hypothetical protein